METYFDNIPEELNYIILSYLKYDEIDDIYTLSLNKEVDFKTLFSFKHPKKYREIIEIFTVDSTLRRYRNKWDILYKDYELSSYQLNSDDILKYNPITFNIYFTDLFYRLAPQFFWIKKKLYEKGFHSDYLSMYLVGYLHFLDKNNKSIKDIKNVADLSPYSSAKVLYFLLIFLFIDMPNFGMSPELLIDYIGEEVENCLIDETGYDLYGFTLKSTILNDILDAVFNYSRKK